MMQGIPIVFIHLKNAEFLNYSLGQARKSNPESDIYLIGDKSNDKYDFVRHFDYVDFFNTAEKFSRIYRHWSTNSFEFELFCFQRWLVLRDFMISQNVQRCFYVDSDIMIFTDMAKEHKKFAHFDLALSKGRVGCNIFINSIEAIEKYCRFLMDIYSKKDRYNYYKMLSHYVALQKSKRTGGACDMTAFELYCHSNFGAVGEVSLVNDGSVFDPNINFPDPGFEMENGIKKVIWKDDGPYGFYLRTQKEVKFNSLHFQGKAKSLMPRFFNRGASI